MIVKEDPHVTEISKNVLKISEYMSNIFQF